MSIVSQSGAFGTFTFVVAKERGLPVNIWVSTGSEADVDFADCVEWLAGDDQTAVVMGYMEGCCDGPKLRAALATARQAGKPVIVMKVGRTALGAAAVQSHTAALAGTDAVFDAVFRQDGAYRASTVDEFLDVGYACLAGYRRPGAAGWASSPCPAALACSWRIPLPMPACSFQKYSRRRRRRCWPSCLMRPCTIRWT